MQNRGVCVEIKTKSLFSENLGQKAGEKSTKLSNIGFSMECFTPNFLQFFKKKRRNLTFRLTAGYSQ